MVRLLLFDIDGTLVNTHGAGRATTRAAMLRVFGTVGALDTHKFSGKTDWYTLLELLTPEGFKPSEIERRLPQFQRAAGEHLAQSIHNYPAQACHGALAAVQALLRNPQVCLGVVTGNLPTTAPIKLRAGGFHAEWFPIGAYGTDARDRDDLPAIAISRAEAFYQRQFPAHEVIVIGDTAMDVSCARRVGAVAVAVKTGFADAHELEAAKPDYLLDDLTQFHTQVLASLSS
jgi:phosphoglycolate phosphatase